MGLSTFGGNPISMAAANATLDYVLDHDLQANAARTGKIIIDGLRRAAERLPIVKDVRGKGLMFAVELDTPAQRYLPGIWLLDNGATIRVRVIDQLLPEAIFTRS